MVIVSPVRGLRPVDALRLLTENVPKPTRRTSPPFFSDEVIASKTASTALLASPLVRPLESAPVAIRSCLFMPKEPLYVVDKWIHGRAMASHSSLFDPQCQSKKKSEKRRVGK